MKSQIQQLLIGGGGIASLNVANSIEAIQPEEITTVGNLLIQVVIAIVTIFGLFKKRTK